MKIWFSRKYVKSPTVDGFGFYIYLWDNIGGRISEELCRWFLVEFCLKFWHILQGWRFCFGVVGCFLDRNQSGETYWRHLFEPDWLETSLRSMVRLNLGISPRNLSSSIEYRCVWLPTPPSPGLPQGSGCVSGGGGINFCGSNSINFCGSNVVCG